MEKIEKILDKINFKKALRIYIAVSVLAVIIGVAVAAYGARDKIIMAVEYNKISESFRKSGESDSLNSSLDKLAADSKDIINVIVTDKNDKVLYKANSELVGEKNRFKFIPYEGIKGYLKDNINSGTIYKVVREENMLINEGYIKNHQKFISDINDESFFEKDLLFQNTNMLNYEVNRNTGEKLYVIRSVTPIPNAALILKVSAAVFGGIFMVYWIGLALWVYRDAARRQNNQALWGAIVLITNIVGLIIYVMYKQTNKACGNCGSIQSKNNIYCSSCGDKIADTCSQCGSIISESDIYCINCGNKLK